MACTVIGSQTWRAEDCYRKFLNTPELMEKLPVKFVSLDDLDPGLWPEFCEKADENDLYKVVPVRPNDEADFAEKMAKYNAGKY